MPNRPSKEVFISTIRKKHSLRNKVESRPRREGNGVTGSAVDARNRRIAWEQTRFEVVLGLVVVR